MNQTVRYVIMTLLILSLIIWSFTVIRSCQETKEPIELTDENPTDEDINNSEDMDVFEEIDTSADEYADSETYIDPDEEDPVYIEEPSFGEGEFLVIAGAYTVEVNAQKAVKELNQKGYDNAEVRIFLGSQYHSVIVGTYGDLDNATNVLNELTEEGFKDAYVHKRRNKKN